MNSTEDKHRYEFAKKRQSQNVLKEIRGFNDKYENDIIIQTPYQFIEDYISIINKSSQKKLKLLDYCCGTGLRSIKSIQNGIECFGIDISEEFT